MGLMSLIGLISPMGESCKKKSEYVCWEQKKALSLQPQKKIECSGYSSARLECLLWEQEVVSSNLAIPTRKR